MSTAHLHAVPDPEPDPDDPTTDEARESARACCAACSPTATRGPWPSLARSPSRWAASAVPRWRAPSADSSAPSAACSGRSAACSAGTGAASSSCSSC